MRFALLGAVLLACVACSGPRPLQGAKILTDDGSKAQAWSYCDKDNQNNLVYRDRDGGIYVVPRGCDKPEPPAPVLVPAGLTAAPALFPGAMLPAYCDPVTRNLVYLRPDGQAAAVVPGACLNPSGR